MTLFVIHYIYKYYIIFEQKLTVCRDARAAGSVCDEAGGAREDASDSDLDLIRAPFVLYGVKYIDPVPPASFSGCSTT